MREKRSIRLGQAIGYAILTYIGKLPESERENYRRELTEEIRKLKFKERKKGTPLPRECRRALDGLDLSKLDFTNPESYALICDEIMQQTYVAQRAREIQRGLLEVLEKDI